MVGPVNPYSSNLYPPFNDDSNPSDDGVKNEKDSYDLDLEIQNPANQPPSYEITNSRPCNGANTNDAILPRCTQVCTQTCNGGPGCR